MKDHRSRWMWATVAVALLLGVAFGDDVKAGLKKAWEAVAGGDEHDEGAHTQWYTCGMHPWVILPKPGDCPICHMALTPIDPAKFTGEITIPPAVVQNIGVRIATVEKGPLTREIRTVGSVAFDETRVRDVNLKVEGWIEAIHVDYLGAPVQAGEPLFDLYSPALYAAQEEYLQAWRRARTDAAAGRDMLDAARTRLEFFGISAEQLEEIAARGEPTKTLTIRSPFTGLVVEKHANEGMQVTPGMQLYRIADLSVVWVMVTLYEYQLPFVSDGQAASMSLPYVPGQTFEGRVAYVYPTLDERTREVQARLEFDNPGLLLKPGMFATVHIQSTLAEDRVLVPREAVIDTGERQVAFVSLGEGRFEPRDVRIGAEGDSGRLSILEGLRPGERVVVSGQFLLDSESRIREALAKMMKGDPASEQEAEAAVVGASDLQGLPEAMTKELSAILDAYFTIGDTLASDRADGIAAPARAIAKSVDALTGVAVPGAPHFWHQHDEVATVRGKALELVESAEIEDARLKFADLSVALSTLLRATGVPPAYGKEVQELHCPMFREGQGGSIWLQPKGGVRNPFYGSQMLECFDERRTLPVTGAKPDDGAGAALPGAAPGRP